MNANERWVTAIELNLRLPSMVRGKKGFERIVWAFKNVFNYSLAWLFYDLKGTNYGQGPIAAHTPSVKTVEPTISRIEGVLVPRFPGSITEDDQEDAIEMLEWLSLTMLGSPRVQQSDEMDSYLSRYRVSLSGSGEQFAKIEDVVVLRWHGFIPSTFATKILLAAMKASQDTWFAINGETFDGRAYTALKHDGKVMAWKYAD